MLLANPQSNKTIKQAKRRRHSALLHPSLLEINDPDSFDTVSKGIYPDTEAQRAARCSLLSDLTEMFVNSILRGRFVLQYC